jgi:hypothetical protein
MLFLKLSDLLMTFAEDISTISVNQFKNITKQILTINNHLFDIIYNLDN